MEIENQAVTKLHQIKPALSLVVPITSNEKIQEIWRNFQELKLKLLEDSDYALIKGEKFAKKSTFRKLALAFGISTEIIKEERREFKNGFGYEISMKAIAPSKRFMTAMASCHSNERKFSKDSDIRAIAQTRATNRCIADLIGWSAPSAEEMLADMPSEKPAVSKDESEEIDQEYINNMFQENEKPPVVNNEQYSKQITEKQRSLLASLINQKVFDPAEREEKLNDIDGLTKQDAHQLISDMLSQQS